MNLNMNMLLVLAIYVCAAYGQSNPEDDIFDDSGPTVYTTVPPSPAAPSDCTLADKQQGSCVAPSSCKTPNHGENRVHFRQNNCPENTMCCVLSDIISVTSRHQTPTPPIEATTPTVAPNIGGTQAPTKGCGVRNRNGGGGFKIKDKIQRAMFGEFPWTVAVYEVKPDGSLSYTCVGSLIHPRVVLTVANRFLEEDVTWKVRAGVLDLENKRRARYLDQLRDVVSAVTHDSFDSGIGIYDVGLLFLDSDILQDVHIDYTCLPEPSVVTAPATKCVVSGWGSAEYMGPMENVQKEMNLPVVDRQTCQTSLRAALNNPQYDVDPTLICAGGNGKDTCTGDGGAPLVCPYPDGRFYQAGITSWGHQCNEKEVPGVYVDVASVRPWIDEQVRAKGYDTSYYTH
ncbi:phenoloxidase-activating factor 2-like isoform X1 [Ostrinia furnacalis]|uniref:phenoloxidase-activating factor 2-like isoform X1 n=2 Tax=Ostrinia furnacalis TaxID=93504 RepID=UPI00103A6410|nr:phenoloxidase-activating factor 2-like isoform X1 [Ostrinia furnacalis]